MIAGDGRDVDRNGARTAAVFETVLVCVCQRCGSGIGNAAAVVYLERGGPGGRVGGILGLAALGVGEANVDDQSCEGEEGDDHERREHKYLPSFVL